MLRNARLSGTAAQISRTRSSPNGFFFRQRFGPFRSAVFTRAALFLPVLPLPIRPPSAISPTFIARLIKGCRGGDHADFCQRDEKHAFSTL
jgi:hypothetical protein